MSFVVLVSVWLGLGQMATSVFRHRAVLRFLLSDMLAVFFLAGALFALVAMAPVVVNASTMLCVIVVVIASWLGAIYFLSCAGVGNPMKRIVFIVLLPSLIAVSALWWVYMEWIILGLFTTDFMTWRMALCVAVSVVALFVIRRINDWVASVDSQLVTPTPTRVSFRDR
jgi:hypothetical protein